MHQAPSSIPSDRIVDCSDSILGLAILVAILLLSVASVAPEVHEYTHQTDQQALVGMP